MPESDARMKYSTPEVALEAIYFYVIMLKIINISKITLNTVYNI